MVMAMMIGFVGDIMVRPNVAVAIDDNEINKILKAKDIVRGMVNYPDTLVFFEFYTKVSGNTVTLKFTAKNALVTAIAILDGSNETTEPLRRIIL